MGKRAASQPVETKVTKEAKMAPIDPFEEELAPVLAHLELSSLNASSRQLLQAMAPFALRVSKEERHQYQNSMVDVLEKVLKETESEQEASTEAAQQLLEESEAEKQRSIQHLTAAEEKVKEQRSEKEAKDAIQLQLETALENASQVLGKDQEQEASLAGEQTQVLSEMDDCKKLVTEKWEPLKSGSFAGKEWRERNKTIDATLQALDRMGLDATLKAALPTALKTKPSERGKFALKAVEFSEVVMQRFLASMEEKISNFHKEAAARKEATVASQGALKAAEAQLEEGKAAAAAVLESLDDCMRAHKEAEAAVQAFPKAIAKLTAALEADKASLQQTRDVISKFQVLKDRKAEEVAAVPVEQGSEIRKEPADVTP